MPDTEQAPADPVQDEFERALARDAHVTAPEMPAPPRRNVSSDPDAPHGRDDEGQPLAPYGMNKKTNRPNLRPAGPGRPGRDKAAEPRTRDATPADGKPVQGKPVDRAQLEPADFSAGLMDAGQAIWFGGSMVARVGPQVPVLGKLVPARKLGATMAVFDSERGRLAAALNLAAQHDQRARKLAIRLSQGEVSWALTVMFMVAPFTGAVAAVWQTSDKHDVLAERELPSMDELVKTNNDALEAMLAKISKQMEAAQLAHAQAMAAAEGQAAA